MDVDQLLSAVRTAARVSALRETGLATDAEVVGASDVSADRSRR